MHIFFNVIIAILVLLAVSSGIMKSMLMPQEVEFFGRYGFSEPLLIAYGVSQVVGGLMLIPAATRILGAAVVAITFLISAVVLFMDDKVPLAIVTLIFVLLLGWLMKRSFNRGH